MHFKFKLKRLIMNTYGLRSINTNTFNLKNDTNYTYPQQNRNALVTFLKVHNLILNILGYIPGVSLGSGCVRMAIGLSICILTLAVGEPKVNQGGIIGGHWYNEALLTGITQIARGALEALVPFGRVVNASLDVIATIYNLGLEVVVNSFTYTGGEVPHTYPDPKYPFPFFLLHLV